MKLLIASVNHENPNTMYINYYHALAEEAEISFYGPGFSTDEELEMGIRRFAEKRGGFDAVMLTFPLFMSSLRNSSIREIYQVHRSNLSDYSIHSAIRYADSIVDEIEKWDIVKIIFYDQDVINLRKTWYEGMKILLEKGCYVMGPGKEFVPICEEQEGHTFGAGLLINNRYRNLLERYSENVISMNVQAVVPGDYFFGPLDKREYDWTVPGNIDGCYPGRGKILEVLKKSSYNVFDKFINRTMAYKVDTSRVNDCEYKQDVGFYVDKRLGVSNPYLQAGLSREAITAWRENYKEALRKSKMAYADGGDVHCLVRKYTEIPANGALLACDQVVGLECWGFRDGENMVLVTPESVLDVTEELMKNPKRMQEIAENGQRLVLSLHTSRKRAEDTIRAIKAIIKREYKGSYWENGRFIICEDN